MKQTLKNMRRPFCSALATGAASLIVATGNLHAANFTPGNLVVERLGDGVQTLASSGNTIYIDEYANTGTGLSPVQSIAIPDSGANAMIESGTASSAGGISLSADGKLLCIPGYNTNRPYSSSITGATSALVPRSITTVNGSGVVAFAAKSTTAYSANNIRSATSDGTNNFWGTGTATGSGGVNYFGNVYAPVDIFGTSSANLRYANAYNNTLWFDTASSTPGYGIYKYTSGFPTNNTSVNTTNRLITLTSSDSPYGFAVNPGETVIYYADDGSSSTANKGIHKWTYSAGAWSQAYILASGTACFGLAVDWTTSSPTLYATTGTSSGNTLIKVVDTSSSAAATTLATAATGTFFRGVAFAPASAPTVGAPAITGITPASINTYVGGSATFTATTTGGATSNFWYQITGGATNLVAGATSLSLTFNPVSLANAGNYFLIVTNTGGAATSSVVSLTVSNLPAAPVITGVNPSSITTNVGSTVSFVATETGSGISNQWYSVIGSLTSPVIGATGSTLTLASVSGANSGSYYLVATNLGGASTSSVVTLTVIDPIILSQPSSQPVLVGGTVKFPYIAAYGAGATFAWHYSDTLGNDQGVVTDGMLASGAVVSGSATTNLTISGVTYSDATNFFAVVTDSGGSVTSSVVSFTVISQGSFALWNFNQGAIDTNHPAPYYGYGYATAVGSVTPDFLGAVDSGGDAIGAPGVLGVTNRSWRAQTYPANNATNTAANIATNKQNGFQFNVSTAGAKNIGLSFDARPSSTASKYFRVQYTTDGLTWTDYPTSFQSATSSQFLPYSFSFVGFPGVDNNPNFGIRVVSEIVSTATYGVQLTNAFAGAFNSYGSTGTMTWDIFNFTGSAVTNANPNPVVTLATTNGGTLDYVNFTNAITLSSGVVAASNLNVTVTPLTAAYQYAAFSVTGSGASRNVVVTPIQGLPGVFPILVTVDDGQGDYGSAWFYLTVTAPNAAPTLSLTNAATLANTTVTVPFGAHDDRSAVSAMTFTAVSGNNTVIPTGNITVNQGTSNVSLTITPAANQVGLVPVSITVNDNDTTYSPRSTTQTLYVQVTPNTNVLLLDYFNYDANPGSLDAVAGGFWNHLSGLNGTLSIGSGYPVGLPFAVVDTFDWTENLTAPLIGAPYAPTNSGSLYASFIVNMDTVHLPSGNGSYFAIYQDGSANTANVEGRVIAGTNGAAPGYYRLGVGNTANDSTAATGAMYPLDLTPGSNYVVVSKLVLSNGFTSLWINPVGEASPNVTDTTPAGTNSLYTINNFELRQSGGDVGIVRVAVLKVGATFDSVCPSPVAKFDGTNVVVSSSDPTLPVFSATDINGPFTLLSPSNPVTNAVSGGAVFYRLGH